VYDKKTLMQMYRLATDEPYSFWYILLTAKKREDMFFCRFENRLVPNVAESKDDGRPSGGHGVSRAPPPTA